MPDEISEVRLKILWLKQSLRLARSDTAKKYAEAMLQEQEAYLAVLEASPSRPEPELAVTRPPEDGANS